jgi:hypothetical protein
VVWLWVAVVFASVLDLRFGRQVGPAASVWDTLVVGALVVALAGTLVGVVAAAFLAGRDPAPAWRRERASIARRLSARSSPEG